MMLGLTTCPACKLMAHHLGELHTPAPREDVEIVLWESVAPLTPSPYYLMQCSFCDHLWREPAPA